MIEIGSKWQDKDGEVYEVVAKVHSIQVPIVWYADKNGEEYVRTEKHFLASFKPYEPVFEYQWAFYHKVKDIWIMSDKWVTEKEAAMTMCDWQDWKPIDFTKRERKQ